jgi:hypothetical protein
MCAYEVRTFVQILNTRLKLNFCVQIKADSDFAIYDVAVQNRCQRATAGLTRRDAPGKHLKSERLSDFDLQVCEVSLCIQG